jgi:hypothetical protein
METECTHKDFMDRIDGKIVCTNCGKLLSTDSGIFFPISHIDNLRTHHDMIYNPEKQQMVIVRADNGKVTTLDVSPEEMKIMGDIMRDLLEDR